MSLTVQRIYIHFAKFGKQGYLKSIQILRYWGLKSYKQMYYFFIRLMSGHCRKYRIVRPHETTFTK